MKKNLLLLDDSVLLARRVQEESKETDWVVLSQKSKSPPDALVIDPAWSNYEGLRFLYFVKRRFGEEKFPVSALLSQVNRPMQALLLHLGIPFTMKPNLQPKNLFSRLDKILQKRPPSTTQDEWKVLVRDWSSGKIPPWPVFEERVLFHSLLKLFSEISTWQEAREKTKDLLRRVFSLDEEVLERSLESPELPWEDLRVRSLFISGLDLIRPFLTLLKGLEEQKEETDRIHRLFSRFLPSEVIGDLLRRKTDAALLRGEKRRVVALFSHVRDFGFYIENNEPPVLVEFLNRHFQLYSDIIRKHGGFINKYIGDAVFALFGAPTSYLDNAQRALDAAVEISAALESLEHPGVQYPPGGYEAGIGLNEGAAIVGNIGSSDSFDYTAIGDTINLAARLESLNKHYKTKILLSEAFAGSLDLSGKDRVLRSADRAKVKGKKSATTFFTVAPAPDSEKDRAFLDFYEKGIKMMRISNWLIAGEMLDRALELFPEDALCLLHKERASRYALQPPENWDGAEELSFK